MGGKYFQVVRVLGQFDVQALLEIFNLLVEDFGPGEIRPPDIANEQQVAR